MVRKIIVLEDNEDRRAAMQRCLEERFYPFEAQFFDESPAVIDYLRAHLPEALVICLDHDLELKQGPDGKLRDPGSGRDVADFLAGQPPHCPVVIHTSNSLAAVGMEAVLKESRWKTYRVLPCGDLDWIGTEWFRTVRRALVGPTRREQQKAP
jgi:CheY-like chemotaxis protein